MAEHTKHRAVLKTLLLSDLVRSTRLVEQLGDQRSAALFKRHDQLARDLLARYDGREIDKTDGFLLLFERPVEAVRYALAYHRALAELAADAGVEMSSRIGIHLGEVFLRENPPEYVARGAKPLEVEGLAKPTAARLMSLAAGRQTLLTQGAFDLARRAAVGAESLSGELRWLAHGAYRFRGVAEPIEVFEVGMEGFAPLAPPRDSAKVRRAAEEGASGAGGPRQPAAPGTRLLDRYELTRELGRGGMGVVYRAQDPLLGREVAVKMIPPGAFGPGSEERFRREARTVARMDHPGIVSIHDFGQHEGSLFLVMPLLEGSNLRVLIRDRSLRLGETVEIAAQVAEALEYSHARGIFHRDVKPENVMVSREHAGLRVRVMDFGLALTGEASRLTGSGGFVGTTTYMSPEQVTSAPIDGRSDLYSLGTVLYECLASEPPFSGAVHALVYRIVHEYPQSLRARGVEVDGELDEIVLRCLAKEPSKRPASAAALAKALRSCQARLEDKKQTTLVVPAPRAARLGPPAIPLVAREAEVAELHARLNAALDGECQLALVEGDAGMGKSRLLGELEKLAVARGIRVLHGRFADHRSALPYQAFCEWVQDYFRGKESSARSPSRPSDATPGSAGPGQKAEPQAKASGAASSGVVDLTDLAPDLVALFPVFSEIAELRAASSGGDTDRLEAESDARRRQPTFVYELVARTLTRLAAGRPLVVMTENLHAGGGSLEGLEYLVRRLGPTPTLFVGTYRPKEVDRGHPLRRLLRSFRDDPRFGRVVLGPLAVDDFRRLVEVMVGSGDVSDDLVARLHEATEGNYFFAQELIRSLVDSKAIRRGASGVWVLESRGGITAGALPATIRQAVERRIDRLADGDRKVLATAAVLGRNFDCEDLEALLGEPRDLDETVDALIEGGLLEEDRQSRGDRLIFSSGIVCDVLYQGLPRRRRRALHRRHAERLEQRFAGRLERVYPRLVHHFSEGDVAAKTVSYGLAQARRLLEAWSPDEAVRTCTTALELVDEEGVEQPVVARGELQLILARAERMAGRLDKAFRAAKRAALAFKRADEVDRAADAALAAAEVAWQRRRGDETWRWVERGIELARAAEAVEALRKLLTLGATVANLRGVHAKAQSFLDEAEALGPLDEAGEEEVPSGGTLVTVLPATVASLDPATLKSDEEWEVAATIFETLLAPSEEGDLIPALCADWESSDDGRTFHLKIRPDVRFSEGSPFGAADVKSSFERLARLSPESSKAALAAIDGFAEFAAGKSDQIQGIKVEASHELRLQLKESLPILPSILTSVTHAITREAGEGEGFSGLHGTGPFRLAEPGSTAHASDRIILERSPDYWRGTPPRVDRIEFHIYSEASDIAHGLRAGEIDLARDLPPEDLDAILRDPRFRSGLVEATKKNVYFVLFNASGPAARKPALRQALAGVLRPHDLVWRTLGRFAQPAVSLIPPGVLGHHPGRRRQTISREGGRVLLERSGVTAPITLRAAVHPLLQNRYKSLTAALLEEWSALGVDVSSVTQSMDVFLRTYDETSDVDLILGRWVADYDDPDAFTYSLFQSDGGIFRRYFSSSDADDLLERARQERQPAVRQELYQQFEDLLERESILVPLFHDVNYRIGSPRVRGLRLSNTWPYVNYTTVGKVESASVGTTQAIRVEPTRLGEIHVPVRSRVDSLDPAVGMYTDYLDVISNIFETLTRVEEGMRIVPWLASAFEVESGGRRYGFRLRENVHFHDGRRLTARDVRYSFERLLRKPRNEMHLPLLPIRGARDLREGRADSLSGLRILQTAAFVIELERPLSFFPALLTHPLVRIVPEGCEDFEGRWDAGCAGTGPFRVMAFKPGERLEMEKNPEYWRSGYPKSDRLVFHFGASPERTLKDFRGGRLSVAAELRPADLEALRRDPEFAGCYRESPRPATYFLALNTRQGPFSDPHVRRAFSQAADVDELLREAAGRLVRRAHGLIPPGFLGYESPRQPPVAPRRALSLPRDVELKTVLHPGFGGQYSTFWERLRDSWSAAGFGVEVLDESTYDILKWLPDASADMAAVRWIADYPDADGFLGGLLHSESGYLADICGRPDIDRLIEAGRSELDPTQRHAIYRQIEDVIARENLLIPLFHDRTYRFCHPSVGGFRFGFNVPEVWYEELHARS